MKTAQTKQNSKLLRTMYPSAYQFLIEKLKEHNIHSFDVQATAKKQVPHMKYASDLVKDLGRR